MAKNQQLIALIALVFGFIGAIVIYGLIHNLVYAIIGFAVIAAITGTYFNHKIG
jgi:hypothetical protein